MTILRTMSQSLFWSLKQVIALERQTMNFFLKKKELKKVTLPVFMIYESILISYLLKCIIIFQTKDNIFCEICPQSDI